MAGKCGRPIGNPKLFCGDGGVCRWCKRILELEGIIGLAIESKLQLKADLLDLRDAISPSSSSVQDSINRARATRKELGELREKNEILSDEVDAFRSPEAYRRLERLVDEANEKLRWRNVSEERPGDGEVCDVWDNAFGGVAESEWCEIDETFLRARRLKWWRPKPEGPEGE